jgi:2-oxoisovalerate dehydrogenase E2 component (dihydrolipoyl transacylase)
MSVNEYKLPDVGEGLTEAEIVSWRVKVGDTIKVNDIVCEIETAKSIVELPSPYAGTVTDLLVPEGETVSVGTPIIAVSSGAAAAPGAPAAAVDAGAAAVEPAGSEIGTSGPDAPVESRVAGSQAPGGRTPNLVGYGPRATEAKRRPRKGGATPVSDAGAAAQAQLQGAFTPGGGATAAPAPEVDEPAVPATSARTTDTPEPGAGKVLAKPPVRKLAKDLGVDLASVSPTGPNGIITRADVEGASVELTAGADELAAEPTGAAGAGAFAATGVVRALRPGERESREPIKGVRKMMAQAMVDSAFTAPHVTEWVTVDVTGTMEYVEKLKAHRDFRDVKVSPLLVVAKAVCLAMRRTPEINATWDEQAQEVVFKSYVNLGIAAATPRGLVVPNVKDADRLPMQQLAVSINELAAKAREGKTQPAEMSGGSFTITNVGVFGVDAGTPIINPGESAILCFGAVRKQPWVVTRDGEDQIVPRHVTTLALSFDHRLIDGEKGSRFLADVAAILEDPANALLY